MYFQTIKLVLKKKSKVYKMSQYVSWYVLSLVQNIAICIVIKILYRYTPSPSNDVWSSIFQYSIILFNS